MPKGIYVRTEEMNKSNSLSKKGKKLSEEHKQKLSFAAKNRSSEVRLNMSLAQMGKKASLETRQKMSLSRIGKSGKYIRTEENRQKISLANSGKKRSDESRDNIAIGHTGLHHSLETRQKMSGENNGNWKNGKTPLVYKIRTSYEYVQWRTAVFTRDHFTCINCGDKTGGNLNADHIKELSVILHENNITTFEQAMECKELWDVENGRTLCGDCHIERHKRQSFIEGYMVGKIVGIINRDIPKY